MSLLCQRTATKKKKYEVIYNLNTFFKLHEEGYMG
jgi:hypothetical protein